LTQEIGYGADIVGSLNILSNIYFNEKDYVNCLNSAREAIATDTTDANVTTNLYANMVRGRHISEQSPGDAGVFRQVPQAHRYPLFDRVRTGDG
jgi:hypothetical protein